MGRVVPSSRSTAPVSFDTGAPIAQWRKSRYTPTCDESISELISIEFQVAPVPLTMPNYAEEAG
eukprot:14369158-Heterocapsa_arctica.AAC.1